MSLTKTEADFLAAFRAGLSGESLALSGADYGGIFTLAGEQKLLPFVYEALHGGPGAQEAPALFAEARARVRTQVLGQTLGSVAFRELYGDLRKAGLHPLVVKGQLCSRLYPREDFRLSGDDDLWLPEEEVAPCHEFLTARGLVTETPPEELAARDEITYRNPQGPLCLEVHRRLFDGKEDRNLNDLFAEACRRPLEIDGYLTLAPQDHLLYLILHAYKHFVARGVGIRQCCDIGLWAKAYYEEVDWARLYGACKGVRAQSFAAAVFGVCQTYLGMEITLPAPWEEAPPEPLCRDALEGGIYGSAHGDRLHASTLTLNAVRSGSRSGGKLPLSTLLPPRSYLLDRYPYLRRRPWLLPWAWAQRLAHYAVEDHGTNNSPAGAVKLARERVALLKQYGIVD